MTASLEEAEKFVESRAAIACEGWETTDSNRRTRYLAARQELVAKEVLCQRLCCGRRVVKQSTCCFGHSNSNVILLTSDILEQT